MWLASIDSSPCLTQLVLARLEPDGMPQLVEGQRWRNPIPSAQIQAQLQAWEARFQMELDRVVSPEEGLLVELGRRSVLLEEDDELDELVRVWKAIVLPARWRRGLGLVMLGISHTSREPELRNRTSIGWVYHWLSSQVLALEAELTASGLLAQRVSPGQSELPW